MNTDDVQDELKTRTHPACARLLFVICALSGFGTHATRTIPLDGVASVGCLGKTVTPEGRVVGRLLDTDSAHIQHAQICSEISTKCCHFTSSATNNLDHFQGFLSNSVGMSFASAASRGCRKGTITTLHAIADKYASLSGEGDHVNLDAAMLPGPERFDRIDDLLMAWRKSLAEEVTVGMYSGWMAYLQIDFEFESLNDVRELGSVFSESSEMFDLGRHAPLSGRSPREGGSRHDPQRRDTEGGARTKSVVGQLARKMVQKRVQGKFRITVGQVGKLAGVGRIPFLDVDFSELCGNYTTMLNAIVAFNQWISNLPSSPVIEHSSPLFYQTRELRSLPQYYAAIPGLHLVSGGDTSVRTCSLAQLDQAVLEHVTRLKLTAQQTVDIIRAPTRTQKDEKLLEIMRSPQHRDQVLELIRHAIAIDSNGSTLLHWAAIYDLPRVARHVLEHSPGSAMNLPDGLGRTPLMRAARNGSLAVARMLIHAGALVNLRDAAGKTAYTYATEMSTAGRNKVATEAVVSLAVIGASALLGPAGIAVAKCGTHLGVPSIVNAGQLAGVGSQVLAGAGTRAAAGVGAGVVAGGVQTTPYIFHPELICDHGFPCNHGQIRDELARAGADTAFVSPSFGYLNWAGNIADTPSRCLWKGIRYLKGDDNDRE